MLRRIANHVIPRPVKRWVAAAIDWERSPLIGRVAARVAPTLFGDLNRRNAFRHIYERRLWGGGETPFFSGVGSRGPAAQLYVETMTAIVADCARAIGRPPRIVDIGCGDFEIGRALVERAPPVEYLGTDIVPELIDFNRARFSGLPNVSFRCLDAARDELPSADICLIRQVLQHLPNADVAKIVGKLGAFREVYVTEGQPMFPDGVPNPDKPLGSGMRFDWRTGRGRGLELNLPPFSLQAEEILSIQSTPFERVCTYRVRTSKEHPDGAAPSG